MGSNPGAVFWMDIFHIVGCKNCIVCFKRPKINEKEARVEPFFITFSRLVVKLAERTKWSGSFHNTLDVANHILALKLFSVTWSY